MVLQPNGHCGTAEDCFLNQHDPWVSSTLGGRITFHGISPSVNSKIAVQTTTAASCRLPPRGLKSGTEAIQNWCASFVATDPRAIIIGSTIITMRAAQSLKDRIRNWKGRKNDEIILNPISPISAFFVCAWYIYLILLWVLNYLVFLLLRCC